MTKFGASNVITLPLCAGRLWRFVNGGPWLPIEPGASAAKPEELTMWRGARRQEIVLIGPSLDVDVVSALLDTCLLSDEEMSVRAEDEHADPDSWWCHATAAMRTDAFLLEDPPTAMVEEHVHVHDEKCTHADDEEARAYAEAAAALMNRGCMPCD